MKPYTMTFEDYRVQRGRLLRLADFLETLPPERFNYGVWVGRTWKGVPDLSCGTSACAAGWATTMPEFQALGLYLDWDLFVPALSRKGGITLLAERALRKVFGPWAEHLFIPTKRAEGDDDYGVDASPASVAKRFREAVVNEDYVWGKLEGK